MTTSDVNAFFDRLGNDTAFAESLAAVRDDRNAVQALIAGAGFTVTPEEVRDAFLDRFGDQLDEAQLAAIAGGITQSQQDAIVAGVTMSAIGITIGVGAAAAAI